LFTTLGLRCGSLVDRDGVAVIITDLLKTDLQAVNFGNQAIFLETHEHLLFDSLIDLLLMVVGVSLEFIKFLLVLECITIQLLLLLLHASVVDLLEVALLLQLVVCRSSFLCNYARFIKLVLKHCELIRKLGVRSVDLRDVWQVTCVELALRFQFVPLLLEALKSALHAELDEEVPQEFVRVLLRLFNCTSNGSLISIVTCNRTQHVSTPLSLLDHLPRTLSLC